MKNPNDSIEQSRLVLLQTRWWAQRGLELLANADEAEIIDQQEVAANRLARRRRRQSESV